MPPPAVVRGLLSDAEIDDIFAFGREMQVVDGKGPAAPTWLYSCTTVGSATTARGDPSRHGILRSSRSWSPPRDLMPTLRACAPWR